MNRRGFLSICGASVASGCTRLVGEPAPAGSPTADETSGTSQGAETTTAPGDATASTTEGGSATPVFPEYETVEVRVTTPDGDLLGSVSAAVADTPELRYRGLSDTERLPSDYGMLFVYDEVSDHTFVMREMDFGIDIVYADGDGSITRIHHAPEPDPDEDGSEQTYPGRGQYVLEVDYHWTTDQGVEEGDVLAFDL